MILMTIMIFQLYVSSWDVRGFTLEPYVVKKTFLVHELSSVDNDSDVDVKMGLDVDVDVDVDNDCMIYISVYKGTNLKIYGSRVTGHY